MKTGLVTFHAAHHYGAMLQAYALRKVLADIGGKCHIVDYCRPHTMETNRVMERGFSAGSLLKNAHSLLHYKALSTRFGRFEAFCGEMTPSQSRRCTDQGELEQNPPKYDCFVCGSDQIWNPNIYSDGRFDGAYLLRFAKSKPKIAYAPSFGTATLTTEQQAELRKDLEGFAHLSAREPSGAEIIKAVTGRDAAVVLDPTLLLDTKDWAALAATASPEPYILCYCVSHPGALEPHISAAQRRLGGLPVWQLAGTRRPLPGAKRLILDAGPREFLSLFQNAAFVLTNSFHGAVFALQFRKPFLCTAGSGEGKTPLQSRIGSLLTTVGLEHCLLQADKTPATQGEYDTAALSAKLSAVRELSMRYLQNALGG